jgi:cytochrome c-type biogenesis protein CcmF
MIVELGHFALILALCLAAVQSFFGIAGAQRNNTRWMEAVRPTVAGQFVFLVLSFVCLVFAFEQNDFSVLYVASTSNSQLPAIYRFTAVWGAHEGSMLLWLLVHAIWSVSVAAFSKQLPNQLISRVLGVLGLLSVGYALFILLTSNPFERLIPAAVDGRDLNPLLQDPAFLIHPPMLYLGYVGMAVPFAFAVAAMIEGKLDSAWARWVRPWTNIAWVFLTIGITLGSWWAYYELGWGGWWFWDPSENAPFMPWLVSTALIHSLAVTEKRGLFKSWTLLLAIFPFSLSLLGTFIVRSGLLTSVHSFAADPERGLFILAFLAICVIGALTLYAWRAPHFKSDAGFAGASRESFILINNALLVVAAAIVLFGTMFPFLIDAFDLPKVSVGEPWFDALILLPGLPLLLLLAFGMHASWKKADLSKVRKPLGIALGVAVVVAIALPALVYHPASILTYIGIALAVWISISALLDPISRWRNGHTLSLSMVGMSIAHLGVGMFVLGVSVTKTFSDDRDIALSPGNSAKVGQYEVHFQSVRNVDGPNYTAVEGEISIKDNGKEIAVLHPQKRMYRVQQNVLTEAGILAGWHRHVSVSMGDSLGNNAWSMRLMYRPMLRFVWLGTLVMALGGFVAALDRRYRRASVQAPENAVANGEPVRTT